MGLFSGLFDFVKSLFNKLLDLLKKLWDIFRKVLAIVLLVAAVVLLFMGMPWLALACAVGAFLIDPETSEDVFDAVGDAASGLAGSVGDLAGDVVGAGLGGLTSSLLQSPIGILAMILLGIWLFSKFGGKDDSGSTDEEVIVENYDEVAEDLEFIDDQSVDLLEYQEGDDYVVA